MLDLSNPAFRAVLDRFKVRLRDDREHLRQLEGAIVPEAEHVLMDIRRIAHRLAGSAGTFGFADVGQCAARLERLLCEDRREPETIRTSMRQLLAALDETDTSAGP